MAEDKNSKVTQNQDRINKLIDGLTLFDDDLMSRVFDKNIEATLNWNPSFQFASLSSDLANRLHK